MVHKVKSTKKIFSEKELEKLEEKVNQELNDEVGFGFSIDMLGQDSKGKFDFEFSNESGEPLDREGRKIAKNIFDRNFGKGKYDFYFSSLFSPFEYPHY